MTGTKLTLAALLAAGGAWAQHPVDSFECNPPDRSTVCLTFNDGGIRDWSLANGAVPVTFFPDEYAARPVIVQTSVGGGALYHEDRSFPDNPATNHLEVGPALCFENSLTAPTTLRMCLLYTSPVEGGENQLAYQWYNGVSGANGAIWCNSAADLVTYPEGGCSTNVADIIWCDLVQEYGDPVGSWFSGWQHSVSPETLTITIEGHQEAAMPLMSNWLITGDQMDGMLDEFLFLQREVEDPERMLWAEAMKANSR